MISARRVILKSLEATVSTQTMERRRSELNSVVNPLRRAGAIAIHEFTTQQPVLAARLLGFELVPSPFEYVGSGFTSTVFRLNQDAVLKTNRSCLLMKPAQRLERMEARQRRHDQLTQEMGSFVVSQSRLRFAADPVFANQLTVQTEQSYVELAASQVFEELPVSQIAERIAELEAKRPGNTAQLSEFAARSQNLFQRWGLLPDTAGLDNAGYDPVTGSLRLIDGDPIGPNEPLVQAHILGQLERLSVGLALAI